MFFKRTSDDIAAMTLDSPLVSRGARKEGVHGKL